MADITVLTLTFNERVHIERCIRSAQQFARAVFVVDCGSTDGTVELARSLGAHVVHHAWENHHGRQVNWALAHLPIETEWVFRLDADEWVTPELAAELNERLVQVPPGVDGIVMRRRMYAFGRQLRWGGQGRIHLLRLWRHGHARCEERWMDEHIVLDGGRSLMFEHDFADENHRPLTWWISKHAGYALREAVDTVLARRAVSPDAAVVTTLPDDPVSRRKRWLKLNVYARVPRFVRPGLFFGYRYLGQLGVLDGVPGLAWHVLQGFWYRFLVDAILFDIERRAKAEGVDELTVIERTYGLQLS
ncbi:MAG: glycosyltransferase family 2 protein, partial [Polyangiales bacterium]